MKKFALYSQGFTSIPLAVVILFAVLAVAIKYYNGLHVLGESTLVAQTPPSSGAVQQPQTQSASQPQQQPQQQTQQQPEQNSQPQQPTQSNTTSPPQQMQQQYGKEQGSFSQQRGYNSGQNGGYGQNNAQEQFKGGQSQQGGQKPSEQGFGTNTQQPSTQQYQQMQQKWQQEAAKYGFQINGSVPSQYSQPQQNPQNTQGSLPNSSLQALPSPKDFATINGEFKVQSAGGAPVNLNDSNTRIQLGNNNSNLSLTALKSDGSRVAINAKALESVVTAMKLETGSEVSQKGEAFLFKRGSVEADTKLPISFNVATKTFSVQTAKGEQQVSVLPDQAVQKLLENKVFSQVQGANPSTSSIQLTELNDQAVYQVQGTSQKKLLGFIPVAIPKTTFVSTQNGEVVTTNQSLLSRVLDTLSAGQ